MWAGNERAHRHVRLAGLEGDVIALPSGGQEGGDLYALFSCGADRAARIVLADCVGHGFTASDVAAHVHRPARDVEVERAPRGLAERRQACDFLLELSGRHGEILKQIKVF